MLSTSSSLEVVERCVSGATSIVRSRCKLAQECLKMETSSIIATFLSHHGPQAAGQSKHPHQDVCPGSTSQVSRLEALDLVQNAVWSSWPHLLRSAMEYLRGTILGHANTLVSVRVYLMTTLLCFHHSLIHMTRISHNHVSGRSR